MFQQKPKIKNEHIISEMIKRKLDLEKLGFFFVSTIFMHKFSRIVNEMMPFKECSLN